MNNPVSGWLQARLGDRYPILLRGVDGAITAFVLVFVAQFTASGFDLHQVVKGSFWSTTAYAGLVAAASILKSTLLTLFTGQTALLGLFSRQLRADRQRPPTRHPVPIRPTAREKQARPRTRKPKPAATGRHEAPEENQA
jgi:hypothetical protein